MDEQEIYAKTQEIYAKRNAYARRYFGCGRLARLRPGGKLSTWTPNLESLKQMPEAQMTNPKYRERIL